MLISTEEEKEKGKSEKPLQQKHSFDTCGAQSYCHVIIHSQAKRSCSQFAII
jgi:hypothetical protein